MAVLAPPTPTCGPDRTAPSAGTDRSVGDDGRPLLARKDGGDNAAGAGSKPTANALTGQRVGSRAPLAALPNGSPSKAVKGGRAAAGKPTPQKAVPQKRSTPANRKRGPRLAAPAKTQQPPDAGQSAAAAPDTATQATGTPKQDRSGGRRQRPNTPGGRGVQSPAVDTKAPPTVSALVRRYAGGDARPAPRHIAHATSKLPRGPSAASEAGVANSAAAVTQPQVQRLQLQGAQNGPKFQAQPQQAARANDGKTALQHPPLSSAGEKPLQPMAGKQGGSDTSHNTGEGSSRKDAANAGSGSSTAAVSSKAPPVSAAEVRARAAGIEAFKAFQQRQQELRRRRRSAAGARLPMAPVPEGRLLLTARQELAAAEPAAADPAQEQGFGAPPSQAGGQPASGGAPPSAEPYTNAPGSPSASSVHANPLFDAEVPAPLQGGLAGTVPRLLSSVLLRHGAGVGAPDEEYAAMVAAAGWAAEAAACSNPVSPRCPPSVAGTCASEWAGADVELPVGSPSPGAAAALDPGAAAFRPAAGLNPADPQAALLHAFLTTTAELRDRMRTLEQQNDAIAGFLVSGDASRLSTPAGAQRRRRRRDHQGAPSEIGYDGAARRLGRALQGAAGPAFGMRRSASRGSYRSFHDGYASEVSGFSAYSTAAGPRHGRSRGAPSAASSEFDAAFEQGYRYAGSVRSQRSAMAAGSQNAAPAAAPQQGSAAPVAAPGEAAAVHSRQRRGGDSGSVCADTGHGRCGMVACGAASPAASQCSNLPRWQ